MGTFDEGRVFVDLQTREVLAVAPAPSADSAMKKIGEITCDGERPGCAKFTLSSTIRTLLPKFPDFLTDAPLTFTYEKRDFDIGLWDLTTSPPTLLTKVDAASLKNSLFPEVSEYHLFARTSPPLEPQVEVPLTIDGATYFLAYRVATPAAGLLFDACTVDAGDHSQMVKCSFIDPRTREIVRTKQALVYVEK